MRGMRVIKSPFYLFGFNSYAEYFHQISGNFDKFAGIVGYPFGTYSSSYKHIELRPKSTPTTEKMFYLKYALCR